jgi:hypothetical protein
MSAIDDLVRMGDRDSLGEILNESDDYLEQIEAAEGLIRLGDQRGLEHLLILQESEDEDIAVSAAEALTGPEAARMLSDFEAQKHARRLEIIAKARTRLQAGRKVFLQKVIYVNAGDILLEDPMGEGFTVPALEEAGLEGWEIVNIIPRRNEMLVSSIDAHFSGAYFIMKKEIGKEEASELDSLD